MKEFFKDWKKYLVEALGTCLLVLLGVGTLIVTGSNIVATSLAFGITLFLLMLFFGPISGGHFNPAVSLAMLITKKQSAKDFGLYVASQMTGALVGGLLLLLAPRDFTSIISGANNVSIIMFETNFSLAGSAFIALGIELILSFILITAILFLVSMKKTKGQAPIYIALVLTLVYLVSVSITGGSLNPARTIGALVSSYNGFVDAIIVVWVFLIGPFGGAALAALVYKYFFKHFENEEKVEDKAEVTLIEDLPETTSETPQE